MRTRLYIHTQKNRQKRERLPEGQRVIHFIGEAHETRHLILNNEEAIVSPSWSINSGMSTSSYTFIWAMAGENMAFTDMDAVPLQTLQ